MAPTNSLPTTPARLSSLATRTLTQILELTRSIQDSLSPSPSLPSSIARNLSTLALGIQALHDHDEDQSPESQHHHRDLVKGLRDQYLRLVTLCRDLGPAVVQVEFDDVPGTGLGVNSKGKGKVRRTGQDGPLVDSDEESYHDDPDDDDDILTTSGVPLQRLADGRGRPPHVAVSMPEDPRDELAHLEQDEDELRRANSEVMQMQQQMMDDQDETLTHLSSAIARQHQISLSISNELELQESLLDDTDAALDRTQNNLRRASGSLGDFTRRAKETGSTGAIVALVVVLLILVIIFKT